MGNVCIVIVGRENLLLFRLKYEPGFEAIGLSIRLKCTLHYYVTEGLHGLQVT